MDFLEWIDVPVTFGSIRRLLRFKLDTEWLESLDNEDRSPPRTNPTLSPRIKGLIDSL